MRLGRFLGDKVEKVTILRRRYCVQTRHQSKLQAIVLNALISNVIIALLACFLRHQNLARTSAWDEIESVVAAGKEVTIHEAPIIKHGFRGSGFVAIDTQTGAGSYLIEGGARGGVGNEFRNALQISLAAALTLGDVLLSLVIGTANAATGNQEFDDAMKTANTILDVLGSILSDISGKVGEGLLKLIGGVLGVFMKLKDLFSILSSCSGVDAFIAFSAFAMFAIGSAVFLQVTALTGFGLYVAIAALGVAGTVLVDSLADRCRRGA